MAFSLSSFSICIFFLMASMAGWWGAVGAEGAAAAVASSEQPGRRRGPYRLPGCAALLRGESWRRPKCRPPGPAATCLLAQEDLASSPASLQPSPYLGLGFSQREKKKKARPISIFNLVIQVPRGQVGTALAQEDEAGLRTGLGFPICGWVG